MAIFNSYVKLLEGNHKKESPCDPSLRGLPQTNHPWGPTLRCVASDALRTAGHSPGRGLRAVVLSLE